MYEEGLGVQKDVNIALSWYISSAEQGYPWAQCNYGFCLQNAVGIEKNEKLGAYWYERAALQGMVFYLLKGIRVLNIIWDTHINMELV